MLDRWTDADELHLGLENQEIGHLDHFHNKNQMTITSLDQVKALLRPVPDFPKKGILFQDIFPIFQNPQATKCLVNHLTAQIKKLGKVDSIVGLDSRGFLLGPWIAHELGCAFVPVRKSGKLPPPTYKVSYVLEYGTVNRLLIKDSFEISQEAIKKGDRVVILDDLIGELYNLIIATGGSAKGAGELIGKCGGQVVQNVFIIELTALGGRKKLIGDTFSLFQFDD